MLQQLSHTSWGLYMAFENRQTVLTENQVDARGLGWVAGWGLTEKGYKGAFPHAGKGGYILCKFGQT